MIKNRFLSILLLILSFSINAQELLEKQHNRMAQQMSVRQDEPELPEWARQLQGAKTTKPTQSAPAANQLDKTSKSNKNQLCR